MRQKKKTRKSRKARKKQQKTAKNSKKQQKTAKNSKKHENSRQMLKIGTGEMSKKGGNRQISLTFRPDFSP